MHNPSARRRISHPHPASMTSNAQQEGTTDGLWLDGEPKVRLRNLILIVLSVIAWALATAGLALICWYIDMRFQDTRERRGEDFADGVRRHLRQDEGDPTEREENGVQPVPRAQAASGGL